MNQADIIFAIVRNLIFLKLLSLPQSQQINLFSFMWSPGTNAIANVKELG